MQYRLYYWRDTMHYFNYIKTNNYFRGVKSITC